MLNLNTNLLSNIPVFLPPIETQHRIADILSAYDAAGELVYRDTRWGADQGWIEETYIRP